MRLADALRARLTEHLPLEGEASWDETTAACVMEELQLQHAEGIESDWQQAAALGGVMQAELLGAGVGDRAVEPLIASLLDDVLMLAPEESIAAGELSEKARATLTGWREEIRDNQRIPVLIFQVSGALVRKLAAHAAPDLYASQAPKIGAAHVDDYVEIG